jgi:hypothetical protein
MPADTMENIMKLRELEQQKSDLEDWFWQFPDSPNESVMRNEYMLVLGEIEELKTNADIYE